MSKRIQKGFTLIELMLIVAIIGIMAAIALPAYLDFTVRTKVSELVLAASSYKTTVAEAAQDRATLTSSGVGLTVRVIGKVSGGSITDDGVITVSGDTTTLGVPVSITLTPTRAPEGTLTWVCSTAPSTFKFVPAECRN